MIKPAPNVEDNSDIFIVFDELDEFGHDYHRERIKHGEYHHFEIAESVLTFIDDESIRIIPISRIREIFIEKQ